MPPKIATRSGTRKAGKHLLNSLAELEDSDEIEKAVRQAFQEAQRTVSVHKTQVVILRTIYQRCRDLGLLEEFGQLFCRMINKILPTKRTDRSANRIVKFISTFVTSVNPNLKRDETPEDSEQVDAQEDADFCQFVQMLTTHLMRGFDASNRNVRFRVCHLLSHLMHNMSAIDKDLFDRLSQELLVRIYDKEPGVRMKAVMTLASFQEPDGSDSMSDAAKKIQVLMQNDQNPEVRRVCMKQIEKSKLTEPSIFERARDVNSVNRRVLYSTVLPKLGDFRAIDSEERYGLMSSGLRDRDESVRKAAKKWMGDIWTDTLKGDILEFVERLKVVEHEDSDLIVRTLLDTKPEIAKKLNFNDTVLRNLTSEYALLYRVMFQYANDHKLDEMIEQNYPEAAEFADVLKMYFNKRRENLDKIESHQQELEDETVTTASLDIIDPDEYDYVILQLLIVASDYDYHDEFGRSKMLNVLRSILSQEGLNEDIINVLILCISRLSISERDFSQMIIEIINDIRDAANDEKGEGEAEGEKREDDEKDDEDEDSSSSDDDFVDANSSVTRASIANKSRQAELEKETMQVAKLPVDILCECLVIAKRMLELVKKPLKDNMYIGTLLHSLIRPALQRPEVDVRVLALTCMGLCCILDKDLAIHNMFLCGVFITKSDNDKLIIAGLKVIADLLAVHGVSILGVPVEGSVDSMAVAKLFYRTLRDNKRKEVQAVSGEALYKLFLSGIINDDELFETTLLAYFNPSINDNEALKQCLSFCIPVFAFSHVAHQEQIARVVADTLIRLFDGWEDSESESSTQQTLSPQIIIQQLMYWTDPYRVVGRDAEDARKSDVQVTVGRQLLQVLEKLDTSTHLKPFVRAIFAMLPKLTFTEEAGAEKLQGLLEELESDKILQGGLGQALIDNMHYKNAYTKFKLYVEECLAKACELEGIGETKAEETKPDLSEKLPVEQSSFIEGVKRGSEEERESKRVKLDGEDEKKEKEDEEEGKEDEKIKSEEIDEDNHEEIDEDNQINQDNHEEIDNRLSEENTENDKNIPHNHPIHSTPVKEETSQLPIKEEAEEITGPNSDGNADDSSIIVLSD